MNEDESINITSVNDIKQTVSLQIFLRLSYTSWSFLKFFVLYTLSLAMVGVKR